MLIPTIISSALICIGTYIGFRYGLSLGQQVGHLRGWRKAAHHYRGR